jgi:hypothetical protein
MLYSITVYTTARVVRAKYWAGARGFLCNLEDVHPSANKSP